MPLSYCAKIVHDYDYDRYLCTLFAPVHCREAWLALFAFDHEIAAIGQTVSEEMVGFVKFAWWRDALDKIYTTQPAPQHPVVEELTRVIYAYRLPRTPFDALLEARLQDLQKEPFEHTQEVLSYGRETSGNIFRLCAIAANMPFSALLENLGIVWALIDILRADDDSQVELLNLAKQHLAAPASKEYKQTKPFKPFLQRCEFRLQRLLQNTEDTNPYRLRLKLMFKLWLGSFV
jgi:phytoene synthase